MSKLLGRSNTRVFDGKAYTFGHMSKSKRDAQAYAKSHRAKGKSCRVVPLGDGYWGVFVR